MSPRFIIILLIVITLAFVAVLLFGFGAARGGRPNDEPPGWVKSIGTISSSDKLKLSTDTVAGNSSCAIDFKSQTVTVTSSCEITIKPAEEGLFSNQSLRTATFRLIQGTPTVRYKCAPKDAKNNGDLCEQDWPKEDYDRSKGSIVILKGGGTISFNCPDSTPCKLRFEH